ncbi:MAG: site-specific DNA-methyltransferase [Planctomycetaceae bacterium]|nr:site-specific DNA-methyltransferase [Planctomycetaceae bacterium]
MKSEPQSPVNRLILGDNLEILKTFEAESIDLIYLDPPFFSNKNYEIIWGDEGEMRSFQDRWAGGISHYVDWLKERVEQMYRVLKKTGCLFLHCDWHANAYIRVEILDRLFGIKNFVNEIIWCYAGPGNVKNRLAQKHDMIYFYAKSSRYFFDGDRIRMPYNEETIARTARGASKTGIMANVTGDISERHKNRLNEDGKFPEDYWTDIPRLQGNSSERIGYPTQKPEALLERIIKMASKEGNIVLDPFMGGGTTLAVAERLGRRFIGIDQSTTAVKVAEVRLQKQMDMFSTACSVQFHKYNYNKLRYEDAFAFQDWIVQQFGGEPSTKKRGDLGIDGKMPDNTPIQVKRSDNINRIVIDNFKSAAERADKKLYDKNKKDKKPVGYIIAFSFNKGAMEEAARLRLKENIIIELVEVGQIVPLANGPAEITVEMHEVARDMKGSTKIEFIAKAKSESTIKFYSWDFEYDEERGFKASVLVDYEGKQTHPFSAGEHAVAVKAVDNDGLESLETFKIKVNGIIKKF